MRTLKTILPVIMLAMALLAQNAAAAPGVYVPDAPAYTPATLSVRPSYLLQLDELKNRQKVAATREEAPELQHRVARGETLGSIARKYGTSVEYLMSANGLRNPNFIREGQVLTLVGEKTAQQAEAALTTHKLKRGETVWDLARRYGVGTEALLAANEITDPRRMMPGQELTIPVAGTTKALTPTREVVVASRSATRSSAGFIWPVAGYISSGYGPRWGRFHYGIDIAANTGTPITAIASGNVTDAGWRRGYGYMVRIDHQNGWVSVYGHSSRLYVRAGEHVQTGQQISAVGQTGNATGPHLHLEMILNGKHQNPIKHLPAR